MAKTTRIETGVYEYKGYLIEKQWQECFRSDIQWWVYAPESWKRTADGYECNSHEAIDTRPSKWQCEDLVDISASL